ncbi:MAG TPA: 50S ribosomal protein L29 [Chitinophagales bacterium]|nr:50S ribosomal protein L29 [Chitinophagales bacterium]MCB0512905.1 50S ribosomal protein L29 [Bacteroidota bacterium]MCB9075702.1 50S ribosomal protein L29 [Chitinophagales bacterium]HMU98094.1 50S ribosomal protein L29 [Chitinophagales bacterium]HMV03263.1 50S ribosomal protein L29 [Chitinophagales bacterium]
MSKNKLYTEIANTSTEALQSEFTAAKMRLTKMKFNHAVSPLEDTSVLKKAKKEIARMATELNKRKLSNQA